MHVDLVLRYIAQRKGMAQAKSCIVAYRVMSAQEGETDPTFITEGFDDSNEEGSGQKLLSLL